MRRLSAFLSLLFVGLGGLAIMAHVAVARLTAGWFDRDLTLRSRLAVAAAQQSLAESWLLESQKLARTLADITRDERIMAAAACTPSGELLAASESYPKEFSCRSLLQRMGEKGPSSEASWSTTTELPSGRIHLSVNPVADDRGPLGSIVLVHDLSYLSRREATTRNWLFGAFFVLSLVASLFTVVIARLAWRDWTRTLRRALQGDAPKEFRPLLSDVRALVVDGGEDPTKSDSRPVALARRN